MDKTQSEKRNFAVVIAKEAARRLIARFRGKATVNAVGEFSEIEYFAGEQCHYNDIVDTAIGWVDTSIIKTNHVYLDGLVVLQYWVK